MISSDMYMTKERIADMLSESEKDRLFITAPFNEELLKSSFAKISLLFRIINFVNKTPKK